MIFLHSLVIIQHFDSRGSKVSAQPDVGFPEVIIVGVFVGALCFHRLFHGIISGRES